MFAIKTLKNNLSFSYFFAIFDVVWLRFFEYQTIKKNLHENVQWIRNC